MVTREGSSSRAVWKTRSSYAKRNLVVHATTSTDIEVGEAFEEAWKVAVVYNYKENPMMGSIFPFGIWACKIFFPLNQQLIVQPTINLTELIRYDSAYTNLQNYALHYPIFITLMLHNIEHLHPTLMHAHKIFINIYMLIYQEEHCLY